MKIVETDWCTERFLEPLPPLDAERAATLCTILNALLDDAYPRTYKAVADDYLLRPVILTHCVRYHVDESLEPHDDDRCCAWSVFPWVVVTGPDLGRALAQCEAAVLATIDHNFPPIQFEEVQMSRLTDRPKFRLVTVSDDAASKWAPVGGRKA